MKEKQIRSEYLMIGCSVMIAFACLFFRSEAELSLILDRVIQFVLPIAAIGLFYKAWEIYQDKEQPFYKVILWSLSAMLVALVRPDNISKTVGSFKVFFVALLPLLAVELIIFAISKSWTKSVKNQGNKEKSRKYRFALWSAYFVLFVGFTVFLGVMWKNDYWQWYHLCFARPVLFVGFPMICIGVKRWLSSFDLETPMLHLVVYTFAFVAFVLLIMWADHGIGTIYMREEQMNVDRSVYYLVLANIIGLSGWSRAKFGKNVGIKKVLFALCLNIGIFGLSPLIKVISLMSKYLSETQLRSHEARYYNSMVFISETYGIWPLVLMTGLAVIVCVALAGWKKGTSKTNNLPIVLAIGFVVRMVLVLLQWHLKVLHVQVPFPFCGTGMMDIAVLLIMILGCCRSKERGGNITTVST